MTQKSPDLPLIVPAILSSDFDQVQQQLDACSQMGVEVVHIDVIDGQFAPNATITPADFFEFNWHSFSLDVHLLTQEPLDFAYELEDSPLSGRVRGVIAQVERMSSQLEFVEFAASHSWQAGLALDIFTPSESLEVEALSQCQALLSMNIEAGAQGRSLHNLAHTKLQELQQLKHTQQLDYTLISDGSVNSSTIKQLHAAGAEAFAVGSALWQASDALQAYQDLQKILQETAHA